jgi:hypothetical protein
MNKAKQKTPTLKEKVKMYENFLHKINMCVVYCDDLGIQELVHNADMWSYMHRCGNGEPSEKEQQRMVNEKFWKLLDTPKSDKEIEERQRKYSERQNEISNQGS